MTGPIYTTDQCRVCWLAKYDPYHRQAWSSPRATLPTSPFRCDFRSQDPIGIIKNCTCPSPEAAKVYECRNSALPPATLAYPGGRRWSGEYAEIVVQRSKFDSYSDAGKVIRAYPQSCLLCQSDQLGGNLKLPDPVLGSDCGAADHAAANVADHQGHAGHPTDGAGVSRVDM